MELLGTIGEQLMFADAGGISDEADYRIERNGHDNIEFTIQWITDDDETAMRDGQRATARSGRRIGWVPRKYTHENTTQAMPAPTAGHYVSPPGDSDWFQWAETHEVTAAGFLCTFKRSDLRSVGGFDNRRRG